MVKPGAAVIDVGITRTEAGLVGDVAADVADVAGWLAPMPGGVGPMTRAMLLANVVEAAEAAAWAGEVGQADGVGEAEVSGPDDSNPRQLTPPPVAASDTVARGPRDADVLVAGSRPMLKQLYDG